MAETRKCGHPLGSTRWCPGCELAERKSTRPMTLGEQVRDAQRKVLSWPAEKRANVRLEGTKGGITE